MAKVLDEQEIEVCTDCVEFHFYYELPSELETREEIDAWRDSLEFTKYAWDIADQWSEGYNEFSVSRCGACGDTRGGDRYACTVTLFE